MESYRLLAAVCAVLVISAALSLPVGDQDLDSQFEEWKKKHEKVYSGPEEEAMRRTVWEETLKKVEAHNKEADEGLHTYWMGMNQFSDRTEKERQRGCAFPPRKDLDLEMEQHMENVTVEAEHVAVNSTEVVVNEDVENTGTAVI